jgi:hypothetical protein
VDYRKIRYSISLFLYPIKPYLSIAPIEKTPCYGKSKVPDVNTNIEQTLNFSNQVFTKNIGKIKLSFMEK